MLSRMLVHRSIRGVRSPAAVRRANSAHWPSAAASHCTLVWCTLNLAALTTAPQAKHSTSH
jgi:hypothetical protein